MGMFDRVSRILRGNINSMIDKAEDPKVVLDQAIRDMVEEQVKVRQGVAKAIAAQKNLQRQYAQAKENAAKWQERAKLALSKGEEALAREALVSKNRHEESAAGVKQQLDSQSTQVASLKSSLMKLESKISEAKARRNMLVARAQSAKATQQINETLGRVSTDSAFSAFDRMEEKVNMLEAESSAVGELFTDSLEGQFAALEAEGGDIEGELAAMKAQMALESGETQAALPEGDSPKVETQADAELEALRAEIDKL
ncbi:PspA/IM30 family protein [Synechococcus sp. PCC 7336]|uniref:PspA/IM30 family protein n=1 Tax=Synechococcus sp. PCC 7336 TaxID=195250 RepID=UPI00034CC5FB|nr:PspA/IM30 family protein [Synechococcus sp. PCC 7336]